MFVYVCFFCKRACVQQNIPGGRHQDAGAAKEDGNDIPTPRDYETAGADGRQLDNAGKDISGKINGDSFVFAL